MVATPGNRMLVVACIEGLSNVGAVATYESAGFQQLPEVRDLYRDA